MASSYDDIINLLHYEPRHRRMGMEARAAQFAPFAALTGHAVAIAETGRRTCKQQDLSDYELQELSRKISDALSSESRPELLITYFQPDSRKTGGEYLTVRGKIKKVEECFNLLILMDGREIPLTDITDIKKF